MGRGNLKNQFWQIFGIIKVNFKEDFKKLHNEEFNLCHLSNIIAMKIWELGELCCSMYDRKETHGENFVSLYVEF
jgi:hypothetical protein